MKKMTLFFCCLVSPFFLFSQNEKNYPAYQKALEFEEQEYFAKAGFYYEKAYNDALTNKDTLVAARAGLRAAVCDLHKLDFQDALERLPAVVQFFKMKKGEEDLEYADALYRLGVAWRQKEFGEKSKEYLNLALPIFEKKGDDEMIFKIKSEFSKNAHCISERRRYLDEAWFHFNKVSQKNNLDKAWLLLSEIFYFSDLQMNLKVNEKVVEVEKVLSQITHAPLQKALIQYNLSSYLNADKQKEYTETAQKNYQERLGENSIRSVGLLMGKIYKDHENGLKYFDKAKQIIQDSLGGDDFWLLKIENFEMIFASSKQEFFSDEMINQRLEIIERLNQLSNGNHPLLFEYWEDLAQNYADRGENELAVKYWNKAKNIYEKQCGYESF